jgi:7-cyano-7-deazaguanine synthase in queuosine biosynthesis
VLTLPYGREGNLWADLNQPFSASATGDLSPEAKDLIDVATAIFHADKCCPRGMRENWIRSFTVRGALRNPDRFAQIAGDLVYCLQVLGGDNFRFEISRYIGEPRIERELSKVASRWPEFTCAALLSGGQDSVTGAADLLQAGEVPLFLRVNTRDKANLREIRSTLNARFHADVSLYTQSISSLGEKNWAKETSQRLRSFYFLAISAAICSSQSIDNIYINENGIMAIHLPLDVARASTFSTRTAYPLYLSLLESVIRTWLGNTAFRVRNSWVLKTKTEVLQRASELNIPAAVKDAISCAHSATIQQTVWRQRSKDYILARTAKDLHCGYCFPCLLRRISMWASGLEQYEITYACDPFKVAVDGEADDFQFIYEATSAVFGLIRFLSKFDSTTPQDLVSSYPQIAECSDVMGLDNSIPVIQLHRRFSDEAHRFIAARAPYLEFLFDRARSEAVARQVQLVASDETIERLLLNAGIQTTTDAAYEQLWKSFEVLRLRLQIALANNSITPAGVETVLTRAIASVVRGKRHPIKITQSDGKNIRLRVWQGLRDQPCPPFWN